MSVYMNGKKINGLFVNGKKIVNAYLNGKMVFPHETGPLTYERTGVVMTSSGQQTSDSFTISKTGIWEMVLIGGGGAYKYGSTTTGSIPGLRPGASAGRPITTTSYYRNGGVGGTLVAKVSLTKGTVLTLKIGAGGNLINSVNEVGTNTVVSSNTGVTLTAGGGQVSTANTTGAVMGSNSWSGSGISIQSSNPTVITSSYTTSASAVSSQPNSNWSANTYLGSGGYYSYNGTSAVGNAAGPGYIRLRWLSAS